MQQLYRCPDCGYPVAFTVRFCGNCGTSLNNSTQLSKYGQQRLPQNLNNATYLSNYDELRFQQEKTGVSLFAVISLVVIGLLIGVLIAGGIIIYDSSVRAPVSAAAPVLQPQPQPQSLTLSAPILSSPGLFTDQGQTIDTITPTFQWNTVYGADYYSLIISKFPYGSGNIVCTPAQIGGTSLTVPDNVLEYGQKYRWAIEAHTYTGSSSLSNALYFQTPPPPPLPQSVSTPAPVPAARQPTSISPSWTPVTLPGWTPI